MTSRLRAFASELKRRRVFRVAGAYLAVGLGVIYAGDAVLPRLGLENAQTVLVVLVILGFPLALALAWAFDVTPEGVERTRPVAVASAGVSAAATGQKSIVVLPFDNMSPDPEDRYLGDGLTEEITAKLSKLRSLRVISRTSAMALKGTNRAVPAVAKELDVQYVLEGSVRKAGDALRITAQLIDALRDEHLWSESYSGTVEDVFGMQEKVSLAIVDALRVELSPDEARRLEERPFQSFQAYQFYVRAMADAWLLSDAALARARETAEKGLASVGDNELLLVVRGWVFFQYVNMMLEPPDTYGAFIEEAQRCADRALELNPRSAGAHGLQNCVYSATGKPAAAVAHCTRALQLDPNNPEALLWAGYWRAGGGWDLEGSRNILEHLERVDPLTPINAGARGWLAWFGGDYAAAIGAWADWWRAMEEQRAPSRLILAYFQAASGDVPEAIATVDRMQSDTPSHLLTTLGVFLKHAWLGEKAEALATVTEELEKAASWDDMWPLCLAAGYATLGETDRAFRWLDHAVGRGIANVRYLKVHDPFLAHLRSDPRFDAILAKAARVSEEMAAAAAQAGFRSAGGANT